MGFELKVQLLDAICELFVMELELETRNLRNIQYALVHPKIKLLFIAKNSTIGVEGTEQLSV